MTSDQRQRFKIFQELRVQLTLNTSWSAGFQLRYQTQLPKEKIIIQTKI